MDINIEKAISVIDTISEAIISDKINTDYLEKILYGKQSDEIYNHLVNKWNGFDGDFFRYYLDTSSDTHRAILEGINIEVEEDKYPDYNSRVMAQIIEGKEDIDIYPFQIYVVKVFALFGYNHSLDELKKISETAWNVVADYKINRYGNTPNWFTWWNKANTADKSLLMQYICTNYK